MPLTLKTNIDNLDAIEKAARRRVLDDGIKDRPQEQIDTLVNRYVRLGRKDRVPRFRLGNVLNSENHREYLRDAKFFVSLNNEELIGLESEIESSVHQAFGTLSDMQREAESLNSLVSEEEIKLLGNFDKVHFNAFVRQIDMGLSFDQKAWLTDFKTELSFQAQNIANIIPGTGLSLPLKDQIYTPLIDAVLVGEETDVGDSRKPIMSTSPRNLFRPGEVFRHVIMRKEHDATGRKFNRTPSYCTIQLELASFQLINFVEVKPIGQRALIVQEISYVNEAGEIVPLDLFELDVETNKLLLFEPIRTRYLKIKFEAFAPVGKTQYDVRDWRVKELNDVLRGAGWTTLLKEHGDDLEGRVFDFSLEEMRVGLNVYEPLGVFRSKPVRVRNPLGVALSEKSEAIQSITGQRAYGLDFSLPEGVVLNEFYLGVRLRDRATNTRVNAIVPLPDSYPVQREFMPVVGGQAKAKLFPDLVWDLEKIRITDVAKSADLQSYIAVCTTATPHGLQVGDTISLMGPLDYGLLGTQVVGTVTDDVTFGIRLDTWGDYLRDESDFPKLYFYEDDLQEDPISFYRENDVLTIGSDYDISLDGGGTWHSTFPRTTEFQEALTDPQAGNFRVRITNPDYSKTYWIEYRPYKNQNLSRDKLIRLKNGRVVFDKTLRTTRGSISTIVVSRSENANLHVTPVLLYYALKVRENVS